jgi:hypothetical protein
MPYLISGITAIRDYGAVLISFVALYSFVRSPFEYRETSLHLIVGIWARQNLTAKGIVNCNRFFRFVGHSMAWWLGWSVILVGLFVFFPGAFR